MITLPIAQRWFELKRVSDGIPLLWERQVVPLMRCNIWHVRGRDRDLVIDTGMGIASLRDAARHPYGVGIGVGIGRKSNSPVSRSRGCVRR
ncbi:hypothetical protein PBR20603_03997 [Pandoraea bronchicola]|uniref:MBL fold metallo-hydrolase n=1 Tax=Pandoraea bronchicola TaxID=2508287 RepID=A0A5E5BW27_9BURK|nr:hypothetical protein PBR20603_03997 [Pandoraea bronchicola]